MFPHPTCPRLGEQPRDAAQVGFAPVGSLLRAQPHTWPQHCLVLALPVLQCLDCWVSPQTPSPPSPSWSCQEQGQGWRDSEESTRAAAAAPTGEP